MAVSDHHGTTQRERPRRRLGLPHDLSRPAATGFRAPATTTPATAPPATAPPATQPTASTTNDLVDRWIVPLVALAIGILVGLGASLLFRRRHPAGLGGSGRSREV
jgi:hypothetical protein